MRSDQTVTLKMAAESRKDQYCGWEFDLYPSDQYYLFVRRSRPGAELIELEIEGVQQKYEFIQDYRLQFDGNTARDGWNKYLLTEPAALKIHTLSLKDSQD